MTRKQFISLCNSLNVKVEIEGTPMTEGRISLDAPEGYLLGATDIHYADLVMNNSWTMAEAYDYMAESYLSEPPYLCDIENCEVCNDSTQE